jgi:hypothetical protein
VKLSGIVDSGAGDLESALNNGHFKVTSTGSTTFTIPLDTSGVSATYSSGGLVTDNPFPILTARANRIQGFTEIAFDASTKVVRLTLMDRPVGAYDTEAQFEQTYGRNEVYTQGPAVGGAGKSGGSDKDAILNNVVSYTTQHLNYGRPFTQHGFKFKSLDDQSGAYFGTDEFKVFSGRMAGLAENTNYEVLEIDDVGLNAGGILLKLSYIAKETANADVFGGEISWLLPVTAGTNRAAIKYKDFNANENANTITWAVNTAAGTTTNTGKFTLRCATSSVAGTGNFFVTWKVEMLTSELEGTGIDWDADVTIPNGA